MQRIEPGWWWCRGALQGQPGWVLVKVRHEFRKGRWRWFFSRPDEFECHALSDGEWVRCEEPGPLAKPLKAASER